MMTDDEIERLALAAGCYPPGASRNYWAITDQMLRRFAELAQEIERNNADNLRQQVEDQAAEIQRLRALLLCQYKADAALYAAPAECDEAEHVAALAEHDAVHAMLAAELGPNGSANRRA